MAPGQHADFCYLRMLICHKLIGILLNTCVIPLAGTVFHITIREKLKRRDCPKKIYSTANGHCIFVCKKAFVSDNLWQNFTSILKEIFQCSDTSLNIYAQQYPGDHAGKTLCHGLHVGGQVTRWMQTLFSQALLHV